MKQSRTAAALLMSCLALSACGTTTKRVAEHLPTPPERLVCEPAGTRPTVAAEYQIDWGVVARSTSVAQAVERAKAEVGKLIGTIRTREGVIAGYVLKVEGKLFTCFTNMQWRRDYEAGLAQE